MEEPRVVAVVGARGGCGTTTLTANLAAELASSRTVCALDLDFGRGDLAGLLNLSPAVSIPKLLTDSLDPAKLRGSALSAGPRCSILAQPTELSQLVRPTREEVTHLLDVARQTWDLVLVDCGDSVSEAMLAAVHVADRVMIVATADVLAIQNVVRLLALLREVGVSDDRRWLVLSQLFRYPDLSEADIEALLKVKIHATFRRDHPACADAARNGKIVKELHGSSDFVRDIAAAWDKLTEKPAPAHTWKFWPGSLR
jgi:pilus assembly protein CpaE